MDISPEGGADSSNKGTAVGKGKKKKRVSISIAGMHLPRYMFMVPSAGRGDC